MKAATALSLLSGSFALACIGAKPVAVNHGRDADDVDTRPAAGEAVVVFLRLAIRTVATSVYDVPEVGAPRLVAILAPRNKFAFRTTPGPHTFMIIGGGSTAFLGANLQEGKTYDVVVAVNLRTRGEFSLQPISGVQREQFRSWLADAKWVETTHESLTWAHENAADIEQRRAKHYPRWLQEPEAERLMLKPEDGQ